MDSEHLEAIDQAAMCEQALRWSAINSGTGHLDGLAKMADELTEAFSALPGKVELVDPAPVVAIDAEGREVEVANGRHLVCRVRPEAERRLILTGHMDTVFPPDHPFQENSWLDDKVVNGPGTADMKGGIAVMLHALMALERSGDGAKLGYDVMINADEETGSLSSAALIEDLARGKYAALTYEPAATPEGMLAHARGGSGNYSLTIKGRAAHAGRNPQDGRNAVLAASAIALKLEALQQDDISINPAKIDGGSANNVVPEHAVLRFNIRPKAPDAADRFAQQLTALVGEVQQAREVDISVHGGVSRPPKPVDRKAQALFDLVRDCGAQLGQEIDWKSTGGVCDGNNIAATGVPVVDTMGVRGGKIHSADEFMIVPSLSERAALSALVLSRIAKGDAL
ncbi:hydrolase [Alteriqipengyuania lutimaris]|uniref:Hydrolase n=1 Tax=Alteriqipengyuania lutimaris TaxID=1538146 RepID=A0A395LR73_9SPHN|nr:hydrolase [Alteriqipengyuania lutimaris]MBB3033872.1 glutamate carboxypeptidase [Alteriqipengyuania lutimaris]RDS77160.1 hydrolase [Alteriqipengyuania lutimaris]